MFDFTDVVWLLSAVFIGCVVGTAIAIYAAWAWCRWGM